MTIALPDTPGPRDVEWFFLDWSGELTPAIGGPSQHIDRLGARHAIKVSMPTMQAEPDGRIWTSRLKRGKKDGDVLFKLRQMGFDVGSPGTPLVDGAHTTGPVLNIKDLTAGYSIKEGQWLSINHAGRYYFHSFGGDFTADGSGDVTVTLDEHLRVALSNDDVIEIADPVIEGFLEGEMNWAVNTAAHAGLEFMIVERK